MHSVRGSMNMMSPLGTSHNPGMVLNDPDEAIRRFADAGFDADGHMAQMLASTGGDMAVCMAHLDDVGHAAKQKMRELVHTHYQQFISASEAVKSSSRELLLAREEVRRLRRTVREMGSAAEALQAECVQLTQPAAAAATGLAQQRHDAAQVFADDVELAVCEQDFDKAVDLVVSAADRHTADIPEQALWQAEDRVVSELRHSIRVTPAASKPLLKHLVALGRLQEAADLFFKLRTKLVLCELQRVKHTGDMGIYARNASGVVFRSVALTHREFAELMRPGQQPAAGAARSRADGGGADVGHSRKSRGTAVGARSQEAADGERVRREQMRLMMRSASIRWVTKELERLGHMLRKQIFAPAENFQAKFAALAEVFKACRDVLEPKGLNMLPFLHDMFQEPAQNTLVDPFADIRADVERQLSEESFAPQRDAGDGADELTIAPLIRPKQQGAESGRASRQSACCNRQMLLCMSTQVLIENTAGILRSVRGVCLNLKLFDRVSEDNKVHHGERPYCALLEQIDKGLRDTIKYYNEQLFEVLSPSQSDGGSVTNSSAAVRENLVVYAALAFICQWFIGRTAWVCCRTFHYTHATHLQHLESKSTSLPSKFLKRWVREWAETPEGLGGVAQEFVSRAAGTVPDCVRWVVKFLADLCECAYDVFGEMDEEVHTILEHFMQPVFDTLLSVRWWGAECQVRGDPGDERRPTVLAIRSLVMPLWIFVRGAEVDELQQAWKLTPDELDEGDQVLYKDDDRELGKAQEVLVERLVVPPEDD
eukprot:TRINITY_DN20780_c0_g1_i1.p1 TRINITY_DN20780_c0_g1~~TRINITY_DN20780_c0_g1_i1.p1  ORF type:complete len:770 (+),score=181.11 TRINITY_DN20780_c0_g1_i1:90-2399(+)